MSNAFDAAMMKINTLDKEKLEAFTNEMYGLLAREAKVKSEIADCKASIKEAFNLEEYPDVHKVVLDFIKANYQAAVEKTTLKGEAFQVLASKLEGE